MSAVEIAVGARGGATIYSSRPPALENCSDHQRAHTRHSIADDMLLLLASALVCASGGRDM
jgi:hypothetical protein